jgi:uncharacterized protein (TIGR03437 family)
MPGLSMFPELTALPGGEYEMGDHYGYSDPQHPSDEIPLHKVWIDPLMVGTYHITNRQYAAFLNSAYSLGLIEVRGGMVYGKGRSDPYCDTNQSVPYASIGWNGATFTVNDNRANHPAVGVRWFGAAAYCNWLSQQQGLEPVYDTSTWTYDLTGHGFRLPTEAEWEYAGRGGQYSPYYNFPWGNEMDSGIANWPDRSNPYQTGDYPWTTPVGFFDGHLRNKADFGWPGGQSTFQTKGGSNGWGLFDMAGNVWQWINDWYGRDYYSASPYKNPPGPNAGSPQPDGLQYRGMRGGSWLNGEAPDPGHARVSNRDPSYFRGPNPVTGQNDPNGPWFHVGFRVARSVPALSVVSAATQSAAAVAPGSIASASGTGLGGDALSVTDSAGATVTAEVLFASATLVMFVVPSTTAAGQAIVTISSGGTVTGVGGVAVRAVAPGLFSADGSGQGTAAGLAVRIPANGVGSSTPLYQCAWDGSGCSASPVGLGAASDQVFLTLFGTGMRGASQSTATVGGVAAPVASLSAEGMYDGLDRISIGPLPRSLAGRGTVPVEVTVSGSASNSVTVNIQ